MEFFSRDGVLGTSKDVVLTPGAHTLTYSATNSAGMEASAQVSVTVVADMKTVDLSLADDALTIMPPGGTLYNQRPISLALGKQNDIALKVANTGTDTQFDLSLSVAPPGGGSASVLQTQTMKLAAFQERSIMVNYTPTVAGTYSFTGNIANVTPTDSNTSNNTKTWTVTAGVVPVPLFDPPVGIYHVAQTVFIGSMLDGATILYTTDGSNPSPMHVNPYTGPITVSSTTTIKARAFKSGFADSDVASATYKFN